MDECRFVESIGIGESMYYGPGAGQKPTATSVTADIIAFVAVLKMEMLVNLSMNLLVRQKWQIHQM